jgi:hypothetical protein
VFGSKKKDILANGIQARATITNVQDTGTTINDNPRVALTLQVQAEGDQAFEVTKKTLVSRVRVPRVGDTMWVRFDPADRSRVEFDTARTDEVNAAARAAVADQGALAGGLAINPGSTVIDARNVPGLREELLKAVADAQGGGATGEAEVQAAVMRAMQAGAVIETPGLTSAPAAAAAEDPLDRIKKLNDLRLAGALTDAEFEAQKAKILAET